MAGAVTCELNTKRPPEPLHLQRPLPFAHWVLVRTERDSSYGNASTLTKNLKLPPSCTPKRNLEAKATSVLWLVSSLCAHIGPHVNSGNFGSRYPNRGLVLVIVGLTMMSMEPWGMNKKVGRSEIRKSATTHPKRFTKGRMWVGRSQRGSQPLRRSTRPDDS